MEQRITHACGHEQVHYLAGFASQQDRKARWLKTTKCRLCFVAEKRTAQADAASREGATIAHLDLPTLTGSERQVAWATTIRAGRLAALIADPDAADANVCQTYLPVTDAKWWIDHRDLTNRDLLANPESCVGAVGVAPDLIEPSGPSRAVWSPRTAGVVESTNVTLVHRWSVLRPYLRWTASWRGEGRSPA